MNDRFAPEAAVPN
jgi:hypothetical protein